MEEQNSPQAIGVVQHQTPDTTSPSPPHPYPTNGGLNGYSSNNIHPSGIILTKSMDTIDFFLNLDGSVPLWASTSSHLASNLCKFYFDVIYLFLDTFLPFDTRVRS